MTTPQLTDFQIVRQSAAIHPDWDAETHLHYLIEDEYRDPSRWDWKNPAVLVRVAGTAVDQRWLLTAEEVVRFFEKPWHFPELMVLDWLAQIDEMPPLEVSR